MWQPDVCRPNRCKCNNRLLSWEVWKVSEPPLQGHSFIFYFIWKMLVLPLWVSFIKKILILVLKILLFLPPELLLIPAGETCMCELGVLRKQWFWSFKMHTHRSRCNLVGAILSFIFRSSFCYGILLIFLYQCKCYADVLLFPPDLLNALTSCRGSIFWPPQCFHYNYNRGVRNYSHQGISQKRTKKKVLTKTIFSIFVFLIYVPFLIYTGGF